MTTHEPAETRSFSHYVDVLRRRRWTALGVFALVFGTLASYALFATPVYRASALVTIEKVSDPVAQTGGYQPPDEDYLATQAKLIVSETALRKVYHDLKLGESEEFASGLGSLRGRVNVLSVPRTRLVYVNAESVQPRTAAAISNALAENFVKQNLDNQLSMPKDVLNTLVSRAKGPAAQKVYESLPQVLGNHLLQDLKSQILKGELSLTELRAKYTDEHPAVAATAAQLALIRAARARELDNVIRSVVTQLSGQLRPNNVRIIDPAGVPKAPARPRTHLALALGLFGGLALGLIAALARDSVDETVRTHQDVEKKLGLPFLAEIPHARPRRGRRIYEPLVDESTTIGAEAFRDLRTMLAVARHPSPDPFLLVTSTVQQEGKSFVATNLAVALAQLGRKVLLVDGDLRRPSVSHNMGASEKAGLSDFLAGKIVDAQKLLQKTDVPHLDVIAAGQQQLDASKLLNGAHLAELVAWARSRYDRVIVDCPPVFPVGDVLLWGRHVRPTILISRCGRTRVPLIQLACDRLRAGGVEVIGSVLNGAKPGALSYAYGRYLQAS